MTEGCLLLPYWQSLTTADFYDYYAQFGPRINRYFAVLTIIAALIPILICTYCLYKKSDAFKYSVASALFAILFVTLFYIYFKDANQQFFDAALNAKQLQSELITWGYWHWLRVLLEFLSLGFLMLSFTEKK